MDFVIVGTQRYLSAKNQISKGMCLYRRNRPSEELSMEEMTKLTQVKALRLCNVLENIDATKKVVSKSFTRYTDKIDT